jgi:serine/threonine-protein kinase
MEELLLDLKKSLISPNEDFVMMIPLNGQDKTRVIGADELAQINKGSGKSARDDMALEEEDEDEEDEDDEDGILNPKMEKAVTIMGIVAAVIIIGILVFIVGNAMGIFKFGGSKKGGSTEATTQTEQVSEKATSDTEMVPMIDVTKMTLDDAKTALEKIGLKVAQDGTASSDDIEEGKIVSQSVDKGKKVASNTTIKVVVSSGAGSITIPDVSKLPSAEASKKLTDLGFVVATDYDYSDSIEQDHVVTTKPAANSAGKKGDTVTIVLSRGVETVQVPDVQSKPQADAQAALQNLGLNVNVASSEYNDTVPNGCVISQSIVNKYVDKGTSISLVISKGKKTVYYTYSETITVPKSDGKTYTKFNLVLKDADGNTLDTQEKAIDNNSGSFKYTSPDIANSTTGTLIKKWTYTDASGKTQTDENSSAVKFTQK